MIWKTIFLPKRLGLGRKCFSVKIFTNKWRLRADYLVPRPFATTSPPPCNPANQPAYRTTKGSRWQEPTCAPAKRWTPWSMRPGRCRNRSSAVHPPLTFSPRHYRRSPQTGIPSCIVGNRCISPYRSSLHTRRGTSPGNHASRWPSSLCSPSDHSCRDHR